MINRSLFWFALALVPSISAAQVPENCEPLRVQIEANIAAKGVDAFAVTVVPADAVVAGDVVGTCGNGTRKIVYAKGAVPAKAVSAATAPAPAQPKAVQPASPRRPTRDEDILTECRDGSVVRGRNCKN